MGVRLVEVLDQKTHAYYDANWQFPMWLFAAFFRVGDQ
jgi:hypothetical protein